MAIFVNIDERAAILLMVAVVAVAWAVLFPGSLEAYTGWLLDAFGGPFEGIWDLLVDIVAGANRAATGSA